MDGVPQDVLRLLGPNEQVQLFVKQKIYHPTINVESVILTNQRIILRHPRDLGLKKDYSDFSYVDIANAILDKGILRSTIKCVLRFGGDPLALNDLPNEDAMRAYGIIRENLSRFQTPYATGYPSAGYPAMVAQQYASAQTTIGITCRKCGQNIATGSKFCGACGSQQ